MSTTRRFICVHGHFYQPPRENPWLEAIEAQNSAAPYHDWNARINHECYAANGSSRILNHRNKIVRIVNNYSRMSFNFGPTLLAWMERSAPLTYRKVLDADRLSAERFGGHGSAIAQVYNHIILPLAKAEDRIAQIRWGIADFEHRFSRKPEGMWLAETAVDLESLDLLAQHGIRFTILAPHQCARVRAIATERDPEAAVWHETPDDRVDPTQPYLVRTIAGRSIAVFFYDGPTSRAVAFEGLLNDGVNFARRLLDGFRDNGHAGQLSHIATDGESYGHHHRHGDMALAYALKWIGENSDAQLTNYGQFLENFPPTWEAEIVQNTSWSCSHGVERWRSDCGCNGGKDPSWNQAWRGPLRAALDWLRDNIRPMWRKAAGRLFPEPATARDAYIQVLLQRNVASQQKFFVEHMRQSLSMEECITALKLMEIERHIQLMYTSCGWFFDDIAGIETVQIICYAGRVLQLAAEVFGDPGAALETEFVRRLAKAKSNLARSPHGDSGNADDTNEADIYRNRILPQRIGLEQVGAHYAGISLFEVQPEKTSLFCYDVQRESCEILTSGRGRFAYGRVNICSQITLECERMDFAVLHHGDQNLSVAVRRTDAITQSSFQDFAHRIRGPIHRADLPEVMGLFIAEFGSAGYSLRSLFRDEQKRILQILLDSTLAEMESTLRTIYKDHISLLRYLSLSGMPKPQALALAAQFSLNADVRETLERIPFDAARLRGLLAQVRADQVALDSKSLAYLASQRMLQAIENLQQQRDRKSLQTALQFRDALREFPFEIDFWETQNRWYRILQEGLLPGTIDPQWDRQFRELGMKLDIEVDQLTSDN